VRAVDESPGRALRTPRAAGVAGAVSALLLAAVMILVRSAVPAHPTGAINWLTDSSRRDALALALALVPFAGIFFLWFMGAVRSYFGEGEDKFFATLFLGGGLLFVAVFFVLSAAAQGLVASADMSQGSSQRELASTRQLVLMLLSSYCTRMAAVFTLATTTMARGLGVFPRWLVWLGYVVALVLLFVNTTWSELLFPVWVLTVSSYIFLASSHRQSAGTSSP
jgi:hypothetical protein